MERGKKNIEQRQVAFEQQLKSTPLYASKPIAMAFEEWRSIVTIGYVGMCGDLFNAGHLNILHFADDAIFTLILSN